MTTDIDARPSAYVVTASEKAELEATGRRVVRRKRAGRVAVYSSLTVISLVMLSPFLWMITNSLVANAELFMYPPVIIPSQPVWSNFATAFSDVGLGRALINSTIVASITTVTAVIFDAMAGYAFAKMRFRGRTTGFIVILVTAMIPVQVTMIPLFIMFRKFPLAGGNSILGDGGTGIINTYTALILPFLVTTFGTYLMREMFRMIPTSLLEAARVDGHSEWKIFWRVYLPLVKPGLAAVGLFQFTFVWNEFLIPLVMGSKQSVRTVQVALSAYKGQYFSDWNILMAATIIASVPPFIVFLLGQKHFVRGLAMSGLHGM